MNIKEIPTPILRAQLKLMKNVINNYSEAKKDAKILIKPLHELIKELNNRGIHVNLKSKIYFEDYWKGKNISNEVNNQNPIKRVDEYYNVIRLKPNSTVDKRRAKIIKDTHTQNHPAFKQITHETSRYQLKVAWTGEFGYKEKILEFFDELGLDAPQISSYNTGHGEEHLLLYIFEGSADGFKMLKRSVNVMLNIFCEDSFEIGISGQKI